mmetsp:Transcript_5833/g.13908  ORF Transcript_5833/g.13908 Transcript_5833/m.13908 type:complete len:215 (+) Transcript_5833:253-897(+)
MQGSILQSGFSLVIHQEQNLFECHIASNRFRVWLRQFALLLSHLPLVEILHLLCLRDSRTRHDLLHCISLAIPQVREECEVQAGQGVDLSGNGHPDFLSSLLVLFASPTENETPALEVQFVLCFQPRLEAIQGDRAFRNAELAPDCVLLWISCILLHLKVLLLDIASFIKGLRGQFAHVGLLDFLTRYVCLRRIWLEGSVGVHCQAHLSRTELI